MTTFLCPKCGLDRGQRQEVSSDNLSRDSHRLRLRTRLAELDSLIAALSAERQTLQAESDSIIYPVLSLPTEMTVEVFRRCVSPSSKPRPSPFHAPLILGQICRQWRQIALHTPALWQALEFDGDLASVEILKLWLSRTGNSPLSYYLHSTTPSRAGALIDASILHSHQWQDISFGLPMSSFLELDMRRRSFLLPILWTISFEIHQRGDEDAVETITIQNAPLLHEAHISTFPDIKFDIPSQNLTSLVLQHSVDVVECLALLRKCPKLAHLVVLTTGSASIQHISPLTLDHMESLSFNLGHTSIMDYLTLPLLRRLTITTGAVKIQHPTSLLAFVHRSACDLEFLSFSVTDSRSDTLRLWLRAVPDSVAAVELVAWRLSHDWFGDCLAILQLPDVLPGLKTLRLRGSKLSNRAYDDLVSVLRARREVLPGRALLDSCTLNLEMYAFAERYTPKLSTLTQFRELAAAGMNINLTITGTSNPLTRTILNLGAA
ncbi:hypothetical protein B0H17DRAFT_1086024 [Mycena rosella]|uniref:F-box domain-containing protein n=1 Tax=Mycena rosella TaxID=1033263 RepID=A0AAD7CYG9_MYCRO|nr:hypothetical protein B0H17DRAFT_1086024 [Mycena rosella]